MKPRRGGGPPRARSAVAASAAAALCLAALLTGCASESEGTAPGRPAPSGSDRPASYDVFVPVTDHSSLEAAIARERFVWLPPGIWTVDNPVVISRDTPLYLHGGNGTSTRIVGRDPSRPLFEIERAPLVQMAGVMLKPARQGSAPGARLIYARNTTPTALELLDVRLVEGGLVLAGPGEFRLQNVQGRPKGWVTNAILLDHPDARLTVMGGDISNLRERPRIDTDSAYHIRARRGRLRIYGLSVEAALGPADFRIDSASPLGPHVLSAVRSEGNNGANRGSYRSTLVEVPSTPEPVDLLLKSNIGAWGAGGLGQGRLVSYGGAGTVWLLGNNVQKGAIALVEGRAPRSTLVAVGNFVFADNGILPVEGARRIESGNLYFHMLREKTRLAPDDDAAHRRLRKDTPSLRFVEPEAAPRVALPPVPDDEIPPPLLRPVLRRALPGMLSADSFGARGDGRSDDTAALQALLDADCRSGAMVFIPPGRYRITRELRYNTPDTCQRGTGGWIAGAGRDRTSIERDPARPGSVFVTRSMSGFTVQGLTFRTAAWRPAERPAVRAPNFLLGGGRGVGPASHFVTFEDVRFDGGYYGLGVRVLHPGGNGEGNIFARSEFRNAHIGLGIGGFNVLNNNVYESDFVDNEIAIGHGEDGRVGGIWTIFGARMRGTSGPLFSFRGSASGAWYFEGLDAEAPAVVERRNSGGAFPLLFDRSNLRGVGGGPLAFDSSQSGGPIFLHSRVTGLQISLNAASRSLYGIRIGGEVSGWDRARLVGPHARIYELSE